MEATGFTKDKLLTYLKTNKDAIESLGYDKINKLFKTNFDDFTSKEELYENVITYFSKNDNYTKIFINKLKNINPSTFKINKENIFINTNNGVKVYNLKSLTNSRIGGENSIITIVINNKIIIGSKKDFTSSVYSDKLTKEKNLDYILLCWNGVENMSTEKYIYAKVKTKNSSFYSKILKTDFSIEKTFELNEKDGRFYSILNEDNLLMEYDSMLSVINIKKDILWQQSYSTLTGVEDNYVSNTILDNNGKIYLPISSKGRSGLFVLDIDTGKELAFYENTYDFLVKDDKYIYSYKGEFCILKINTITNEVKEIPLKNVLLANDFDPNTDLRRSTVKGNLLYFTEFLYKPYSRLGVINLDSKELLYSYNFKKENGGIGSIQVSSNRIFVHTQDNTLYIFEKEKTI